MHKHTVSIVTPTFRRPDEVRGLLENIARQSILPLEVVLVDGAPHREDSTEKVVESLSDVYPFRLTYIRRTGGTAVQRNCGIDAAKGGFIAFIDDDVRLDPEFLRVTLKVLHSEENSDVGGVVGYRENEYFDASYSERWRW